MLMKTRIIKNWISRNNNDDDSDYSHSNDSDNAQIAMATTRWDQIPGGNHVAVQTQKVQSK